MKTTQHATAVGVFNDHLAADRAVADLKKAGFRDDQIGVIGRDWRNKSGTDEDESKAGEGAAVGAIAGAGVGGLVGLGVLAGVIPVIGPAIAAGTLGVILSNAAGGAAIAALAGALIGLGIPEEEAQFYENEFKAGRYIVTVKADGRLEEARAILRRHGGYDRSTAPAASAMAGTAGQTMQVHEEELRATKQPVKTGEVRVHKDVITEHRTLDVPVQREEVVIERHPVAGQPAACSDLRAGEEIRIPVKEEQVRVEKQAVVKEEVHVGKQQVQDTEHVSGTVRKEQVRVEREGNANVKNKDKR